MNCPSCGTAVLESAEFCPNCLGQLKVQAARVDVTPPPADSAPLPPVVNVVQPVGAMAVCPLHPTYPAAGTCDRCGRFYCVVCVPNAARVAKATCPNCLALQKPQPMSGLAIAGFVVSLFGMCVPLLFLVGIGLSIAGIVQTKPDRGRRGRGLAIAGLCISLLLPVALAAIAIPNFMRFQARAKQAECKSNLKALYAGQMEHMFQHAAFAKSFEELGFDIERGNRYAYVLDRSGPIELRTAGASAVTGATRIGVDEARFAEASTSTLLARMPSLAGDAAPGVSDTHFTAACVANLDSDEALDVWSVSSKDRVTSGGEPIPAGTPFNDSNDVVN